MNPQKTALARLALSLFAGILFFSSWSLQGARVTPPAGTIPYLHYKAFEKALGVPAMPRRRWKKLPAADKRRQSQQSRLQLSQRLGAVVSDPRQISPADVAAVNTAWGEDSSHMLALLQQASR